MKWLFVVLFAFILQASALRLSDSLAKEYGGALNPTPKLKEYQGGMNPPKFLEFSFLELSSEYQGGMNPSPRFAEYGGPVGALNPAKK